MADRPICNIEGCDKPSCGRRGMCNAHYLRFLRRGDPRSGRTMNGAKRQYLIDHMWDNCPKWPFPGKVRGYGQINWDGRRTVLVHRVVCEIAHGPPPSPAHEAAHECGKGHEGCFGAACLSWKTSTENKHDAQRHGTWAHGERSGLAILTNEQAKAIAADRSSETRTLADRYGVSTETVRRIRKGETWRAVTGL